MTHPIEVQEQWQALAEASYTNALLSWIEEGGYRVRVNDDATIVVERPAPVDHDTHQASCDAAWQIVQVG